MNLSCGNLKLQSTKIMTTEPNDNIGNAFKTVTQSGEKKNRWRSSGQWDDDNTTCNLHVLQIKTSHKPQHKHGQYRSKVNECLVTWLLDKQVECIYCRPLL